MEVSRRSGVKRPSAGPATGLVTHGNGYSGSSLVSDYAGQVAAKQAAQAASASGSSSKAGLSSATRRSLGGLLKATLSMYNDAPQEEITLDQFERAGVDRLQALKQLESLRLKKGALLSKNAVANDTTGDPVAQILTKFNLDNAAWDNLSHFVLRLAYCKTEELRRWLLQQESALFKYRFDTEKDDTISTFLRDNDLAYDPLSFDELEADVLTDPSAREDEQKTAKLRDLLRAVPFADLQSSVYYKVPFEDATDLLRDRKVFLLEGFAYVSRHHLSAIIGARFRQHLSLHLSQTCRATAQMRQDVRIVPLVNMLGKQYITPSYTATKVEGAVTKEQLPALAERSFPLCMSHTYTMLKKENHLKHGARMQFGLFLKGIGLSLQDALAFWKQSFARRTPPEKFDKEYAYNIRHNYGKEGKRTTYTPYGCMKIIMSAPSADDHHGCPFKLFDEARLRVTMRDKRFTPQQAEDILALVKGSHFQIACQRYYAYSHNGTMADQVGSHPNVYFDASEQYWREQQANAGNTATAPANGAAASSGAPASSATPANSEYNAFGAGAARPAAAAATAAPAAAPAASEPAPMDMAEDAPAAGTS